MIIRSEGTTRVYCDSAGTPWVAFEAPSESTESDVVCVKLDSEVLDAPMKFWAESVEVAFAMIERYCPLLRFAFSVDLGENLEQAVFDFGN